AGLLSAVTEKGRHQRLLDELLAALEKVLTDEETLAALRERIRKELPALFNLYRADAYRVRKSIASTSGLIHDARSDASHPQRIEFDSFVKGFIERLRHSEDYARRAEALKRDLLSRPEVAALGDGAWESLRSFLEQDSQAADSQVRRELEAMLVEIGGQLARDPPLRPHINPRMLPLPPSFVQSPNCGVGRFIADHVKSWDIDMLIGRIELTVGRALQYIRFNGAMIGGLAGLALHALEQGLKLAT